MVLKSLENEALDLEMEPWTSLRPEDSKYDDI